MIQNIITQILYEFIDFLPYSPTLILAIFVLYVFLHPDKIQAWSSMFTSIFEKINKRSARHTVSSDIQSRILSFVKNNNAQQILPYGLKFKWIRGSNSSSYIESNDVIVIMGYSDNNARNFSNAIQQYISKAFLPEIRHELPHSVLTAAELIMHEKMIHDKRPDALDIFRDEIFPTRVQENTTIRSIYDKFRKLDKLGHFDNIFLTELIFAAPRLNGLDPNQMINEIKNFLIFLQNIPNEQVPLEHDTDVFSVQIILAAKSHIKHHEGTSPYIKRAKTASSMRLNSLYVMGWEQNMDFVDEIVDEIKSKNIGKFNWTRSFKTLDSKKNKKNAKIALFRL